MSKRRKKTIISEINKIDKRKSYPRKVQFYPEVGQFWDWQRATVNRLMNGYPQGKEQWKVALDEFFEVWNSCLVSEFELAENQVDLENLDDEGIVSCLPIFDKAKKTLEEFLDTKNYSLYQKDILKNSYVIVYLLGLEDLFVQKEKSFQSRDVSLKEENLIQRNTNNKESFSMWLINYYVFCQDFIFEFPQLEWLLEQASDL